MAAPEKIGGWLQDPPSGKDLDFAKDMLPRMTVGSGNVDLEPLCTPVSDQLRLSSCVANAAADAFELCTAVEGAVPEEISRLQIYYNGRSRMSDDGEHNLVDRDEGMYIRAAFDAMRILGVCPEKMWPYKPENVGKRPPVSTFWYSLKHKIEAYFRITSQPAPDMLEQFRLALLSRHPVVFAVPVTDAFREGSPSSPIPAPRASERVHGMHAIVAVGYQDGLVKIRNSWGRDWGRGGYAMLEPGWFTQLGAAVSPFVPTRGVRFRKG